MLPRKSAQYIPGANFQQDRVRILAQLRHTGGKLHRLPEMASPVGRLRRFLRCDPLARGAGKVRHLWRIQITFRGPRGKRLDKRVHHGRMEGVRSDKPPAGNSLAAQFLFEFLQSVEWPGNDAKAWSIHCGKSKLAI